MTLFDYDAEMRRYNKLMRAVTGVRPGDRVLDIGCGAGQSTRDAARAAGTGSALGVDVSEQMVEIARGRSVDEHVPNVTFELADAQTHPFSANHFDIAISRFGTMFFADPVKAFTNIGRALRPGARLAMLVWQYSGCQEWATAIRESIAPRRIPPAQPGGDPFSLADPETVHEILDTAGYTDIHHADLHEPICYGPTVADAHKAVLTLQMTKDLLAQLPEDARPAAQERLRTTLSAHVCEEGVWFDSRAWLVTARRSVLE